MDKARPDFRVTFKSIDDDALINAEEFGELLVVNKQGIYHRLHIKELIEPVIRRNKQVRWRAADVRIFLHALDEVRKVQPGAKRPGRPRNVKPIGTSAIDTILS